MSLLPRWIQPPVFLLLLWAAPLLGADAPRDLEYFLHLDRFVQYVDKWSHNIAKKGETGEALARIAKSWRAADIAAQQTDVAKLAETDHYDDLVYQMLKKSPGADKVMFTREEISWNYNFLKNKMEEAYVVQPLELKAGAPLTPYDAPEKTLPGPARALPKEVTLDVQDYISDRTTRAVFWEASANGREVDFHMGTAREFQDDVAARGAKILGEVKAPARNYNRIFLVQEPGSSTYHYAITQISGRDRLDHLMRQAELMRWTDSDGKRSALPKLAVQGDPGATLARLERELGQHLSVLPKADLVVIGQKGAIEKVVRTAAKAEAIVEFARASAANKAAVAKALDPRQLKKLQAMLAQKKPDYLKTFPDSSEWEDMYDILVQKKAFGAQGPKLPAYEAFNVDRGTYEISDYGFADEKGKPRRVRVISNVWGDEVGPLARALKATGHENLVYMGTAGALPGGGLKVGDLVVASHALTREGKSIQFSDARSGPEGDYVKRGQTVAHVGSPFEETWEWVKETSPKAQLVEVESAYIAEVYNQKTQPFRAYLMISDVVGSEGETLAEASSSSRRRALEGGLDHVLGGSGFRGAASLTAAKPGVAETLARLDPKRDPLSIYQVARKAKAIGKKSERELKAILASEKSFTTGAVEKELAQAGAWLDQLLTKLEADGIRPEVRLEPAIVDGTYNPAVDSVTVELKVADAKSEKLVQSRWEEVLKSNASAKRALEVTTSRGAGKPGWIEWLPPTGRRGRSLIDLYAESALRNDGFVATESRNGGLKFARVVQGEPERVGADAAEEFFSLRSGGPVVSKLGAAALAGDDGCAVGFARLIPR